jgi:hypothetical protein
VPGGRWDGGIVERGGGCVPSTESRGAALDIVGVVEET